MATADTTMAMEPTLKARFSRKAAAYHSRVPYVRRLPLLVLAIIAGVVLANVVVWAGVGVVLVSTALDGRRVIDRSQHFHGALVSTAVLAYTLGLRHALDADHISAIDLMTRRLIAAGKRPVSVGLFFSLGHSTIVVITSVVVAATAAAVSDRFDGYSRVGGIVGTSVSAAFLLLLGFANAFILYRLLRQMRALIARRPGDDDDEQAEAPFEIQGGGCLVVVFKKTFALIDRPWKMYPLGVLFGLGFDTSSEIALLGIASIQAAKGTSIWLILIFPLLFTAGMVLLDTTDGALMMTLYTSTSLARDPLAILYYSSILTFLTVLIALLIGTLQLLSLVLNVAEPEGGFWDGVERVTDRYDVLGGAICGSFALFGALSVLLYKPWRRRVERKRAGPGRPPPLASLVEEERDEDPGGAVVAGEAGPRRGPAEARSPA
ncbi:MAG: hypothetical protein M1832_000217 [Thelocarpon impressellum]|nr:MAG: hypothetical protein M1832_000217 [Thelocarpon impressellum]